jgi:glycerate dehydrogenase
MKMTDKKTHHIVVTDGFALASDDLNWLAWEQLGRVTVHDFTPPELVATRAQTATILIVNKTLVTAETIAACPDLQYIGVTATGYNNVAIAAARARGIVVCNVAGYGTPSVAQHVFALILALTNRAEHHNQRVQNGAWGQQLHFSFWDMPMVELAGKTLGIYGYGTIAKAVGRIGRAFGMRVIATKRGVAEGTKMQGATIVSFETLLKESDFISLNAAMATDNIGIFNKKHLSMMKPTAYLINTARGGLIVEADLKWALESGIIAGAGLDVLSIEPPTEGSVLMGLKNCIITPHQAWATVESRRRLMAMAFDNLAAFLKGKARGVV